MTGSRVLTRKRAAGWLHAERCEPRIRYVGIMGDRAQPWVAPLWAPPASSLSLERLGHPGKPTSVSCPFEAGVTSQAFVPGRRGGGNVRISGCYCRSAKQLLGGATQ